jgi:hypothetical protein
MGYSYKLSVKEGYYGLESDYGRDTESITSFSYSYDSYSGCVDSMSATQNQPLQA